MNGYDFVMNHGFKGATVIAIAVLWFKLGAVEQKLYECYEQQITFEDNSLKLPELNAVLVKKPRIKYH